MKHLAAGFLLVMAMFITGIAVAADTPAEISDANITEAVRAKFGSDTLLANSTIQVDTDGGFVVLTGVVKTQEEIDRALELANSVDGVRQVTSNIKVEAASEANNVNAEVQEASGSIPAEEVQQQDTDLNPMVADENITKQIKKSLSEDSIVSGAEIDVATSDGVVHLSGTVASQEQADRAIEIASEVDGVKSVKSDLVVKTS
jgi:hyperosmotically inducible protein